MANEINVAIGQTGLALTGRLYLDGVINPSVITLTEVAGAGGLYVGSMPGVAAGAYEIMFYANGVLRASGAIEWDGAGEVTLASRLAASAYTAPDNAGIALILGDTNDIQMRLPGALVGGLMPSLTSAMGNDVLTAAALDADAVAEIQAAILAAIGGIPTDPLLDSDPRLDNLDAKISLTATDADLIAAFGALSLAIGGIPTDPLLDTDPRLDNLDAKISLTATAAALVAAVNTILAAIGALPSPLDQWLTDLVTGGYSGDEAGAVVLDLLAALQDVQARLPAELIDGHMDSVFVIPDTCSDDGSAAAILITGGGGAPFL